MKRISDLGACAALVAMLGLGVFAPVLGHEGENDARAADAAFDPQQQSVVTTLSDYAAAVASGDLARIETFFLRNEDFSHFEGSYPDWGWASYREHLAAELPLFSETRYSLTDIRPQVEGDLAFATFAWEMDVTVVSDQFEGGKHPVSMRGLGTAVLMRHEGSWKIRHLHTAREQQASTDHEAE
jgi:ketosteroid isomerase-like protein